MSWRPPPGWRRIRAEVFKVKGRTCAHCGQPATSVDHYPVPAAAGGPAKLWNLVPCCGTCNSSRGASWGNRRRPRRQLTGPQRSAIAAKRAGIPPAPRRPPRTW